MKYRKDFVTNSSSSSYICEICGRNESGYDMSLAEADMAECVNGHIFCYDETIDPSRDLMIKMLLEYNQYSFNYLNAKDNAEIKYMFACDCDIRSEIPEELCPICQFIEYSEKDLAAYLEKEYTVSRNEVFAEIKKFNKRRKKLYDGEYITEVCKRFNLNPVEIVAGWKERFKTYAKFKSYIRS